MSYHHNEHDEWMRYGAGILVFEQCNNNLFAYNSVMHSRDGFFLWAGQYSISTSIYNNQFSGNRIAVAIEHGQYNEVLANNFSNDKTAGDCNATLADCATQGRCPKNKKLV